MRTPIALLFLAVAAAALAAGCGSSGSGSDAGAEAPPYGYAAPPPATTAPSSSAAPATVATAAGELGTFLVGPDGRALYLFAKDTGPASACTGACADAWPPLTSEGAPDAGGGVRAALLGTATRDDGSVQVTYAGHPLYLYTGDAAAGDTNGQGVAGEWYLVAPAGTALRDERG